MSVHTLHPPELTAAQMRERDHQRDLAVWSLYGAVQSIAASQYGSAEWNIARLREAVAECDARLAEIGMADREQARAIVRAMLVDSLGTPEGAA